jgi:ATP-binding cassette subfamily F protein 3
VSILSARDLRKSFRGEPVLDGVSLTLLPGRRYGLVGPNGCGKTTLATILAGLLEPDEGEVTTPRDARVVYLPQRAELTPGRSARSEALSAFEDLEETEGRLRDLEERMAADLPPDELEALVKRHGRLLEQFEARGGWDRERRADTALEGLGVPVEARSRDVATLSGGQATRVSLARALLRRPDLLILDEPTNHLDIAATEWLEDELLSRSSACLVISHDRWFLDRVAESVLELERTKLFSYPGNYGRFEELRAERREREEKAFRKQQEYIRKEEEFIRRNIAAQRVAMARGKRKRLSRLTRLSRPVPEGPRMAIPDSGPDAQSSDVFDLEGVSARLGDLTLLHGLSLRVPRGQRVGVVGPNGVGKTTLLRLLNGELAPSDGRLERGRKLRIGYLPQEPEHLAPGRTVLETISAEMPGATMGECRDYLARFLFRKEEVEKDVGDLSGGESARLALAVLFLAKPNVLVLDEPTNHLDIPGREALEAALVTFPGTVVLVSHDRYLLDGVVDRVLEILPDQSIQTLGGWSDHARRRRADAGAPEARGERESRRARAGTAPPGKLNPYKLARLEEEIIALETRIEEIHEEMAREETYRDPERMKALKEELPRVEAELARKNARWDDSV